MDLICERIMKLLPDGSCRLPVLFLFILATASAYGASIEGQWCENGRPYTCYPPVTNGSDRYVCTDSTSISIEKPDTINWVVKETLHFYAHGYMNGKSEARQYTRQFTRSADVRGNIYQHQETSRDAIRSYKLVVRDQSIDILFEQSPKAPDATRIHQLTGYRQCNEKLNQSAYYTALVDCGGSGDYIAGIPAVIEDPLQWETRLDRKRGASCRVAAKCWGGGWVAYARSSDDGQAGRAFGAACGGESRHDAKQQAINTCRQSGGTDCLATVVSGFDNGSSGARLVSHRGIKVETCRDGACTPLADEQ